MDRISKSLEALKALSTTTSETLTTSNEKYPLIFLVLFTYQFVFFK